MLSGCLPKEIIFEKKRPMNLDPKTIVVINSLGSLIMSIGMFAVSRSYLKEIGGIQRWAFASFLHSFGWIFLGLRGMLLFSFNTKARPSSISMDPKKSPAVVTLALDH